MNYKKKSKLILCITTLLTILLLCGFTVAGAYASVEDSKTAKPIEQTSNEIEYNAASKIYTNDAWTNFSVEKLGKETFQNGDTLKTSLSWDGTGEILLLYTNKDSTEEEIILPLQGLSGVPKPDYDKVDVNNLSSVFNFQRSSTPIKLNEEIDSGTYWFYLIRFDDPGNISGNISRVTSNDTVYGIWARIGRDASGEIISAYQ